MPVLPGYFHCSTPSILYFAVGYWVFQELDTRIYLCSIISIDKRQNFGKPMAGDECLEARK